MSSDDDATVCSDIWPCSVCNWTFHSKGSLEKHQKTHTNDKPFTCQECDMKFATSNGLKIHMRKHTGERPYKCDKCPKDFTTRTVLIMHMRGHTGEKPFVCKICGARYTQNASLTVHMDKHKKNSQYKCQFCEKTFQDLIHRLQHVRKVHYQETCGVCKRKFKTKKGLIAHEKKHIFEKSYKCDICGKKYQTKQRLRQHIRLHNSASIKCTVCGKYIKEIKKYVHMKTHNPDQCSVCGIMSTCVKSHMTRVHGNPDKPRNSFHQINRMKTFRRYICKICGYKTDSLLLITKHVPKCQQKPTYVKFLCDFCLRECPDYQSFESHVFEHSTVPMKLPFLHNHSNFSPALHVKRQNRCSTSFQQPTNSLSSIRSTIGVIARSTNETDTGCSDIANTAINEKLMSDRFLSQTTHGNCKPLTFNALKSSSVVENYGEQRKSIRNLDIQQPNRSYVDQNNVQAVPNLEEISIEEESFVGEKFTDFPRELNSKMINYLQGENNTTSFMHYGGIMYMKPEKH